MLAHVVLPESEAPAATSTRALERALRPPEPPDSRPPPIPPARRADAYNSPMTKSLILRRTAGTFLLLATVGLSTCQGAFNASLPGATISSPALQAPPAPATNHG
jgi:hypothetical protein